MRTITIPAMSLAVAVAVVLGLASCSSDDTDAQAAETTKAPDVTTTVEASSGAEKETYCDIEAQIDAKLGPAFGAGDPEAIVAAAVEVGPLLPKAEAAAPDEIADAVATLVSAVRAAGEGDASALQTEPVGQASGEVDAYCGAPDHG